MYTYQTKQRQTLLAFFEAHVDEPVSALQIMEWIGEQAPNKSTIYRNLSALEEEGVLERISKTGSRERFYRYRGADCCKGHLHLSCAKCGKTYHMETPATEQLIDRVRKDTNFQIDSATTVLYGVCENCQKEQSTAKAF